MKSKVSFNKRWIELYQLEAASDPRERICLHRIGYKTANVCSCSRMMWEVAYASRSAVALTDISIVT